MAQRLSDIVFRRTDLCTGGDPGEEALNQCAEITVRKLGWPEDRVKEELQEIKEELKMQGTVKRFFPERVSGIR